MTDVLSHYTSIFFFQYVMNVKYLISSWTITPVILSAYGVYLREGYWINFFVPGNSDIPL